MTPRRRTVYPTVCIGVSVAFLLGSFLFGIASASSQSSDAKKILYYGWDAPIPGDVKDQGSRLDASVFDAVVFRHGGARQIFTHEALPAEPFAQDIADLQEMAASKLGESYLRMQINAEDDWSWASEDDWDAFASNLRNYARLAKEGGLKGILFDPEPYGFNVWNYETQPAEGEKSFEELETLAKERGAEFINILKTEYPGITLFSLKMFSQRVHFLDNQPDDTQLRERIKDDTFHGLWYGFANGMLSALDEDIRLIDGNERAYYYLNAGDFDYGKDEIYGRVTDAFVDEANQPTFREQVEVAHAVYVDGVLSLFNSPRFIGYYFADDEQRRAFLEWHIYHGLQSSDEYYWLYVESVRWWEEEGVPEGFEEVVARAKEKALSGAELGFDTEFVEAAVQGYEARVRLNGSITPNVPGIEFEVEGAPATACGSYSNGGKYNCTFPAGTTATVTPVKEGITFDPPSRTYENVGPDTRQRGIQDYSAY